MAWSFPGWLANRQTVIDPQRHKATAPPGGKLAENLLQCLLLQWSVYVSLSGGRLAAGHAPGVPGCQAHREPRGPMRQPAAPAYSNLLDRHLASGFLELFLGSLRVGLVGPFEHGLGSAFDEGLGLGQAQAGLDLAHRLDYGDLLVGGDGL